MSATCDVIVLGLGAMGSAACAHLARRGRRVVGLEQFPLVHDRGSSHGETRIIRLAYFEHPDYVPLLHRCYELWDELEAATNQTLFGKTGLLLSGPAESDTIRGARTSAAVHQLTLESLTPSDAAARFQNIHFPDNHEVVFEPYAGYLHVEACVAAHLEVARQAGADLRPHTTVLNIEPLPDGVRVQTSSGELTAARLVVTAGAWTAPLLCHLGCDLQVVRKFVGWFEAPAERFHVDRGAPCYLIEQPHGAFYGFPSLDGQSLKFAEHTGGEPVADPMLVDRDCRPDDVSRLATELTALFPGVSGQLLRHSVCLYTLSPDRHFVVDRWHEAPSILFAAGFSGHGFKFAPVIGEALADLTEQGRTDLPIDFLSAKRFA